MNKAKKTVALKRGKGKSWTDKLNVDKVHVVKRLERSFADMPEGCKMLIATPKIVHDYVSQIPKGKSVSIQKMRKDLAAEFDAEYTCPVTAGIFLRIVSEAAYEQVGQGKAINKVTPFWRVVEENSPLNKKLSFGPDFVKNQRKREGIVSSAQKKK